MLHSFRGIPVRNCNTITLDTHLRITSPQSMESISVAYSERCVSKIVHQNDSISYRIVISAARIEMMSASQLWIAGLLDMSMTLSLQVLRCACIRRKCSEHDT